MCSGAVIQKFFAVQLIVLVSATGAHAADMSVTDAWTLPNSKPGSDVLLGMVLNNDGPVRDALLRVSCPVANFSESRQIDNGEGGKSAREIHSIPIPSKSRLTLSNDQFQVALLQIIDKLDLGTEFVCSLSFRRAGKIQVSVKVLGKAPGAQ